MAEESNTTSQDITTSPPAADTPSGPAANADPPGRDGVPVSPAGADTPPPAAPPRPPTPASAPADAGPTPALASPRSLWDIIITNFMPAAIFIAVTWILGLHSQLMVIYAIVLAATAAYVFFEYHMELRRAARSAHAPESAGPAPRPAPPDGPKQTDVYREIAETVVFVVVLVLLLKTFIAEAFVIPTGSMAPTLWGYQKYVTCPVCRYEFPLNCSSESDPQTPRYAPVENCECPNCRYEIKFNRLIRNGVFLGFDHGNPVFKEGNRRYDLRVGTFGVDEWEQHAYGLSGKDNETIVIVNGKPGTLEMLREGTPVQVFFRQPGKQAIMIDAGGRSVESRFADVVLDPIPHSGDRVLVFKALYDTGLHTPQRHDVVVFKFPVQPQDNQVAMNYIKRLLGLSGETIAICLGQLYVYDQPRNVPAPERYWSQHKNQDYDWPEDPEAKALWAKGQFKIIRKTPELILAMARIVHDNDFLPEDTRRWPIRWSGTGWDPDGKLPRRFSHVDPAGKEISWLRYQHLLPERQPLPDWTAADRALPGAELITDFLGYNSADGSSGNNWVGDLIVEAEVKIDRIEPNAELRLELSRGIDRFQARFDLGSGDCTLVRLTGEEDNATETVLTIDDGQPARRPTAVRRPRTYHLRLANVDERLTLWVDGALPFGHGVDYAVAKQTGPTTNDLRRPASIGVQGAAVEVAHLRVWRDTYYTTGARSDELSLSGSALRDPSQWSKFRQPTPKFMYVQPGHYLCLGDNSAASADSRSWGMVPERLMLGRALIVYFPFRFPYWPIESPTNRLGPIR